MKWNNGKMWRRVIIALSLLMGFLSMAGCGRKTAEPLEDDTTEISEAKTEQTEDVVEVSQLVPSPEEKAPTGVIALETRWENGVLTMPCTVNGLRLRFIFDTGASSVCISSTEALFMLKNGYLDEEDIGGESQAIIANGDIVDSTEIILREVVVGGIVLKNVEATVTHGQDAPLLFGQSAIRQLGTIQIRDGEVTIAPGKGDGAIENNSSTATATEEFDLDVYFHNGWVKLDENGQWHYTPDDMPGEALVALLRYLVREVNDVQCMMDLGNEYAKGLKVPQDFTEAYKWFHMAAENGDARGQYMTGKYLLDGLGVRKNTAEAARWFSKAAAQGIVSAQALLGDLYYYGDGVVQNTSLAVAWYKRAAEQGNIDAQYSLGTIYNRGDGVAKNLQQAIYWYKKAMEQGHPFAMNNLAVMYEHGFGVDRNKREALRLYKQAADIGNEKAAANYRRLLREKEEHDRRIRAAREEQERKRREDQELERMWGTF